MKADLRPVARTGLSVPVLGLGSAPLGWLYEKVADSAAHDTVRHALDRGIGYLDTAPSYGLGVAEQRLGAVLGQHPGTRPVLSTKVGRLLSARAPGAEPPFPGAPDLVAVEAWHPDEIRRSLEESLARLRVDEVDILFLHDPDFFEEAVYETAWPALQELRAGGVVKAIGFGMNSVEMPSRFVERLDVDILLIAGRYNLLNTEAAQALFPLCLERGTSVICGGVLGTGILGSGDRRDHHQYGPASDEVADRVERIGGLCRDHGVPIAAAALQFPLAHPAVVSVVAGMRSPREVDTNLDSIETEIPDQLWTDLKATGLLPSGVPAPG